MKSEIKQILTKYGQGRLSAVDAAKLIDDCYAKQSWSDFHMLEFANDYGGLSNLPEYLKEYKRIVSVIEKSKPTSSTIQQEGEVKGEELC